MFKRFASAWAAFKGDESRGLTFADVFGTGRIDLDNSSVSAEQGMRVSTVFACVKVISETIATLPLHLYRDNGGGNEERERKHRTAGWLEDAPNGKMTWPEAREAMAASLVLRGNGFAKIDWREGYPVDLLPLLPDQTTVAEGRDKLLYAWYPLNGEERRLTKPDILHVKGLSFDGLLGLSPISSCSYAFTNARAQQQHGANVFSNGARLTGILTLPLQSFMNKDIRRQMRDDWEKQVKNAKGGGGTAILTDGTTYSPISMSLADAQFIESQKLSVEEIARIFRVPLHKIQHLDRATFSNIEHQDLEFYKDTLLPWIVKSEHAYNATLLTEADRKAGYFFRHNVEGVLRAAYNDRMTGHQTAIMSGVSTINEARALEKRPPVPGGDKVLVPVNMGGTAPPDPTKPTRSLEPLRPVLAELSRSMSERLAKATQRARGKADEAERLEKFLDDHKRALTLRLSPVLESIESLGFEDARGSLDRIVKENLDTVSRSLMGAGEAESITETLTKILDNG